MDIVIENEDRNRTITEAFQRLVAQAEDNDRHLLETAPILISDDLTAASIYNEEIVFNPTYQRSFGASKGNIVLNGQRQHLVVINMSIVQELQLTTEELDAILAHELGHLVNVNPLIPVPSILRDGVHISEVNEVRQRNKENAEFYADFFAKKLNTTGGLLSGMTKFLASRHAANTELFYLRVEKINSEEVFRGHFIELLPMP